MTDKLLTHLAHNCDLLDTDIMTAIKAGDPPKLQEVVLCLLDGALEEGGNVVGDVATAAKELGIGGLILGPAALGAAGGYMTALPERLNDRDIDAMRQQDLITSYRQAAQEIMRRRRLKPQLRPLQPQVAA